MNHRLEAFSTYDVVHSATHDLHECRSAQEFRQRFELACEIPVASVADHVIAPTAARAIFLTGSVPLGMATNGSDLDFIVLVDRREELIDREVANANNSKEHLTFSNESDPLRTQLDLKTMNGITVETVAVIAPTIGKILSCMRRRGPELNEGELMILDRLSSGWLLWQSDDYLARRGINLQDPALNIYSSTRSFSYSLIHRRKALRALDLGDVHQALYLGRESVELAYLAYFASEGFPYLGTKWLAQIGHAFGAADRVRRHPLLAEQIQLLFPAFASSANDAARYLQEVGESLQAMRELIEQKPLYRIAFAACPQIYSIERPR